MALFSKFKHWKFPKTRTEAFSDGVFAIIITLLILEVKVPHLKDHHSSEELMWALKEIFPKIFSWVVSFFFIAIMWVQHHNLLRMAERIDYGMVWINNIFLLAVCFLPFPTALMGEYPNNQVAVLAFGVDATFATLAQVWLYYYITKNNLQKHYDKKKVMKNVRKAFILAPVMLVVATVASFVNPLLPYIIYFAVPFFFLLPLDEDGEVMLNQVKNEKE